MDEIQVDKIAKAVLNQLEEQRTVDVETHRKHHEYIDTLITDSERIQARKEQWIRVVGGWGLILFITAVATAVWNYLKNHLNG